ncbi:sensor histidine kinase [Goodfellowiella coeruleoviolacea]|uniref:sensor histidine kinase n=1 Tax=Goodfellowiella coeruleoviolacea TaxID=334858 RepID=UPI0020A5D4DB|nr:ATP-binding protein [Goodfellowiella coeruleoviolacea]
MTALERTDGQSSLSGARRLYLFQEQVLRRYESSLHELGSPVLAVAELKEEIDRQAGFVIADCLDSIHRGTIVINSENIGSVVNLGVKGAAWGIRFSDVLVAAAELTTVLAELLVTVVSEHSDASRALRLGLRAINQSMSARMRVLADRHESEQQDRLRRLRGDDLRRLSRDIHDWLGSSVSLATRQLDLYQVYRERGMPEAEDRIVQAQRALGDALAGTRQLVADLRLYSRLPSLGDALWEFVRSVRSTGTRVELRIDGDETMVPHEHRTELFVVVRECLRNVFRHARASRVGVLVDISAERVRAVVEDDGAGFDLASAVQGHGLTSMRERISESLGGELRITSRPREGTRVELSVRLPGRADGS